MLTWLLSEQDVSGLASQIGVLVSYGVLMGGIASRRPDAEVLAWLILGTASLAAEAESAAGSFWLSTTTALVVVLMADIGHTAAILYPRSKNETVDEGQRLTRRHLLLRRVGTMGSMGAASLTLTIFGVSLAPPLSLSGSSAAMVGILAVAALALLAGIAAADRLDHRGQTMD
jgi:hypothetical protein